MIYNYITSVTFLKYHAFLRFLNLSVGHLNFILKIYFLGHFLVPKPTSALVIQSPTSIIMEKHKITELRLQEKGLTLFLNILICWGFLLSCIAVETIFIK